MAASPDAKTRQRGVTRSVHVVVWELANGPVPDGMLVHHIDHDKRNNDLANLRLMSHAEHSRHHNQKHSYERQCDVCEKTYAPHPTKRARSRTCSRPCFSELARRAIAARTPRFSDTVVADALRRVAAGETQKAVAADIGASLSTVNGWVKGRSRVAS